jgi:hypothetical protein
MLTETTYRCELCNTKYNSPEEALKCESRGIPDPSKIPIGLMFEYHHNGFVGIFAMAELTPNGYSKHTLHGLHWAVRVPGYPKYSLGKDMCGGGMDTHISTDEESMKHFIKWHVITKEKVKSPEFGEMVRWLQGEGIIPRYYNEEGHLITIEL